jgi:DNA-binding MarR family transcriptional regulator
MQRSRDSLLDALEAFRRAHPAVSIMNAIAFLYLGENEGLNVTELADLCRTTCATASRTVASLCGRSCAGDDALPALVEVRANPRNAIGKVLYLTQEGRRLRGLLDQIIARQTPIALVGGRDYRPRQAG